MSTKPQTIDGPVDLSGNLPRPDEIPTTAAAPQGKAAIADGNSRAPAGWKRFKVRGETANGSFPAHYILARNQEDAEAHYQEHCVSAEAKQAEEDRKEFVKANQQKGIPVPPDWKRPSYRLVTKVMPD